jgi:hypothetical protein
MVSRMIPAGKFEAFAAEGKQPGRVLIYIGVK